MAKKPATKTEQPVAAKAKAAPDTSERARLLAMGQKKD